MGQGVFQGAQVPGPSFDGGQGVMERLGRSKTELFGLGGGEMGLLSERKGRFSSVVFWGQASQDGDDANPRPA